MGNIRYCRQCGHALSDESRFCEYCGAKVEREVPVRVQRPQEGEVFSPRSETRTQRSTRRTESGEQGQRVAPQNARPRTGAENMRRTESGEQRQRIAPQNARPRTGAENMRRAESGEQRQRVAQDTGERRSRYQQERLQGSWEESWNRELPEEDEHRITPVQYLLLGLIAILIAALVAFGLFWMKGRSGSRKAQDDPNAQIAQTETVKTEAGKDSTNDGVITILDGQAQSESTKQTAASRTQDTGKAVTEKETGETTEKQTEKITEKQTETAATEAPQTQPQTQPQTGSYILPQSSERLLTDSDVEGMSYDDMQMAINEIYARHGRKFSSQSVQSYFDGQSWYQGTVEPDDFSDSVFSQTEGQNVLFLLKKMGIE